MPRAPPLFCCMTPACGGDPPLIGLKGHLGVDSHPHCGDGASADLELGGGVGRHIDRHESSRYLLDRLLQLRRRHDMVEIARDHRLLRPD